MKYYRLKGLRVERAMDQNDMAKVIGMNKYTYHAKENGTTDFKLGEAKRISDFFGLSIEDIFFSQSVSPEDTKIKEVSQ